ncbi:hypothetical protein DP939_15615 [Spongiactinospora rosea]|uniref:ABC transporter permease n=1 Tax=Spongiactinospora rosea TaxID=2248750 RepID=A0A366M0P2_9ACTN|nr:ABC transporter permease subunit [Spongiactinospora rosea]RBQ19353.1 hypothetical protein DP939_15615 [Spongiactinospora rosea]
MTSATTTRPAPATAAPLIRAELRKARATRATLALAIIAPLFCVLWTAVQVYLFDGLAPSPLDRRVEAAHAMAQQGYLFTLILGILAMTGEHRHKTIAWTFLITPRRSRVLTAKLIAWGLTGLAVAAASTLATFIAATAMLAFRGMPVMTGDVPMILIGSTLTTAAYAVLGVAIGALVRNQSAAIAIAVIWFTYADYALSSALPEIGRWLPTGAARAAGGLTMPGGTQLPAWAGALLFAAYITVLVAAARRTTLRRDIT